MKASARPSAPATPARIHLRITHPRLGPEEISRTLAMSPEHTLEAGRSSASGVDRLHPECYWVTALAPLSFDEPWASRVTSSPSSDLARVTALPVSTPHEVLLGAALRQLQPHQAFFQRITDEGGTATLLINLDDPGPLTIHPALARKLADASLGLELDWSGEVD
jgi:hypothetical protein